MVSTVELSQKSQRDASTVCVFITEYSIILLIFFSVLLVLDSLNRRYFRTTQEKIGQVTCFFSRRVVQVLLILGWKHFTQSFVLFYNVSQMKEKTYEY